MHSEDSMFEQIMKLKRTRAIKGRKPKVAHKPIIPKGVAEKELIELNLRYSRLVKEAENRAIPLERVLAIRKELTEIRRLKRDRDSIE
ncbi:hypothetical protein [Paenibacillus sp. O199]|nr:hypothetical protein [Paenibacillus sp. O199]